MYKVVVGKKIEQEFEELEKAKKFARQFIFAQIVDSLGFVRFVCRYGRVYRS